MDSAGRTPSVDESWREAIAVQQNDLSTERGASFQLGRAADGSPVLTRDSGLGMEHLWSQAGATGGNRWQMGDPRKPLKQADPQPVATHGNRLGW
jgi:hypothetical protein